MNEDTSKPGCPECGKPIGPEAPMGLCPTCLIAQMVANPDPGTSAGSDASAQQPRIHYLGDYIVLGEIARGGMGVVYKARQASLNRVVAVKMILAGQLASEADIRRFRTEAEAAANLQHPNIVSIHEVGTHAGLQYFSMDYVEGVNLAESVRGQLPTPKEAAQLVKTLAGAIQYAHQRGILHRDLKPQNVLLDEHGQPRITDFGLAKRLEEGDDGMTRTGSVMGSPGYMPPEQATGRHQEVGPASDVYSLGAILYHALTGQAPFVGPSPLATMAMVVGSEPVSPRKVQPEVPVDLETICLKCLEKHPEKRYATARALAEDLERFLNHEPIQARPASVWRKTWSWSVRNPWAITGAGTLVLLSVLGLAYGLWEQVRHLEWERTRTASSLVQAPGGLLFQVIWIFLGVAAAVQATGLAYICRRKHLPSGRLQVVLGWIAGLSWIAFGLGAVRIAIWGYVWEQRLEERTVGMLVIKALVGLSFAWVGALYLWHVLRNQQVMLFGSDGGERKQSRHLEMLNPKTLAGITWANWLLFWLLGRQLISLSDYQEFLNAHPGFSHDHLRMSFLLAAAVAWWWATQSRGFVYGNKSLKLKPGILVLVCIMSIVVLVMSFMQLGPFTLAQAMFAGLVGGLVQAKLAKLKVTVTTDPAASAEGELDALFDLIHWNEWVLGGLVGGVLVVVFLICSGALNGLSGHSGHFLFIAAISFPAFPLLVAWRAAQLKARPGLLAMAAVAVLGSLAVASNMMFVARDVPVSTALAALTAGYLTGAVLTWVRSPRRMKSGPIH